MNNFPNMNTFKELFSTSVDRVIASSRFFKMERSESDDGIDFNITYSKPSVNPSNNVVSINPTGKFLCVQAKSTTSSQVKVYSDHLVYKLDALNYNKMIDCKNHGTTIYLFLSIIPENCNEWISEIQGGFKNNIEKYWFEVTSTEQVPNTSSVSIKIPFSNKITLDTIQQLFKNQYGKDVENGYYK